MSASDEGLPPLRDVIRRHGLGAKKSLGQNFLLDLNLAARVARAGGSLAGVTVVEVGPGPGGLTRALLGLGAARIIAVERDERAIAALEEIAARYPKRLQIGRHRCPPPARDRGAARDGRRGARCQSDHARGGLRRTRSSGPTRPGGRRDRGSSGRGRPAGCRRARAAGSVAGRDWPATAGLLRALRRPNRECRAKPPSTTASPPRPLTTTSPSTPATANQTTRSATRPSTPSPPRTRPPNINIQTYTPTASSVRAC